MKKLKPDTIKIIILYVVMFFGGLWQILGMFQSFNDTFSGPLLIGMSLFFLYEIITFTEKRLINNIKTENHKLKWILFAATVVISSWLIELAGVKTGYIFGRYTYGFVLLPSIFDVPVAIGFAWFSTLVVSVALMQKFTKINLEFVGIKTKSVIAGFLMMIFDAFLEPAAVKLGYWSWYVELVPLQNYLAWFIFGTIFAYTGYKFKLLSQPFPKVIWHGFIAQLVYFILVYFK